jgi:hypothetical protein
MEEITTNVNWLAVTTGAIAAFVLGALWYSPKVFGTRWAQEQGITPGTASQMPVGAMVVQALGLMLMSWFVGVTAANEALLTVILATLAFAALGYSGGMFANKGSYSRSVDAGYLIAVLVVMIGAQAIF